MATFVLIHGGGSTGWDWHLVAQELRARGHEAIAPDLPSTDETKNLDDYADAVAAAVGARSDVVVVGHSLGGLTAPLVCQRIPVRLLVLVTAMIPQPGETGMEWWSATGQDAATADTGYSEHETFFHDVPADLVAKAEKQATGQAAAAMEQPWPAKAWPQVETRFVLCRDDRLFPADWMRSLVKRRLEITPDEMDGGHYVALSRPVELAERLSGYLEQ